MKVISPNTVIEEYKKIDEIKQTTKLVIKNHIWLLTTKLPDDRIKPSNRLWITEEAISLDINFLKDKEFENVERYAWTIVSKLRGFDYVSGSKIISTAFLAYLAKKEGIVEGSELEKFVDCKLPESQRYFLKDRTTESYWVNVIEISKELTIEALLAVVLWHTNSHAGRFEAEFETPLSVVKLAYGILKPEKEKVADLCSGMGAFLAYTALQDKKCSLYGVEINTQAKEISEIRLSLLSDNSEIELRSALEIARDKTFDKIFCNHPWGIRAKHMLGDANQLAVFDEQIPELKKIPIADWYFILNAANHLNEGGKAVVLTTNGITWNGGISKQIRERFIKMGYLEAVIALPQNMFASTSVATSILVLSKNNFETVRIVDASELATVGRRQNEFSDEAIANIINMLDADGEISKEVTISEIANMDYAVNPSRYLQTEIKVENGVPFADVAKNITRGAQIKASVLDEMVSDDPTPYQYLMLSNIQNGLISEELPYLKELDEKQKKYCLKNNALVVSKNGAPVKIAVASVEEGQKILANGNLYIIELDESKANPYFVKAYLESEEGTIALSRITVGATIPSIPVESLKKILIPNPPIEQQNEVAEKYLAKVDEIKVLKYKLQKATSELKNIFAKG